MTAEQQCEGLDILFVGAHPDDESGVLGVVARWGSQFGVRTGIVSMTRGEGGGNAVGSQEGALLGLLREREERSALSLIGVDHFFYLDKVDFYYTVSASLTDRVWGGQDTLARLVRIVRATRPEVIVTMNPAPAPGQHGNHQMAARLAVEAYLAAGDPEVFPAQIRDEGLRPFSPARLLMDAFDGIVPVGPAGPALVRPADAGANVFAMWDGDRDEQGRTWADRQRDARRRFVSQGWGCLPEVPGDPALIGSTVLTQVASRAPFPAMGTPGAARPDAALAGALTHHPGTLPLGTRMWVEMPATATAGRTVDAALVLRAPDHCGIDVTAVDVDVPAGWTVGGSVGPQDGLRLAAGQDARLPLTVTVAADAAAGPVRVGVDVAGTTGRGHTAVRLVVLPGVEVHQERLPQVTHYEQWVTAVGLPQLSGLVRPVVTIGSGLERRVRLVVVNHDDAEASGWVRVHPPRGFRVFPGTVPWGPCGPGESCSVEVTVANTDTDLETGRYGGDYEYRIDVGCDRGTWSTVQWLELVPSTRVPHAPHPPRPGGFDTDVYTGPALDISRVWEGDECAAGRDCSGRVWLAWHGETLYVAAAIHDPLRGSVLASADCRGHWRTDSLEIDIDPWGISENTSTTFKAAVIPFTSDAGPWAVRDADQYQGPASSTAPGMSWAARRTVDGYEIEVAVPMPLLPVPVDPNHLGLNILYYDSDADRTARYRIGWSAWQGVQGDPYRWGIAILEDHCAPGPAVDPAPPVMPLDALDSADSPQSIEQSILTGVGLSGLARLDANEAGVVTGARWVGREVEVSLEGSAPGSVHVLLADRRSRTVASRVVTVSGPGRHRVMLRPPRGPGRRIRVDVAWVGVGGVACSTAEVDPGDR